MVPVNAKLKGLDANKLLKDYEAEGQCISRNETKVSNSAAEHLYNAYLKSVDKKYETWKMQSYYTQNAFSHRDQINNIIDAINHYLFEYEKIRNNIYEEKVLNNYNMLREMFGKPKIQFVYQLDKSWLLSQESHFKTMTRRVL